MKKHWRVHSILFTLITAVACSAPPDQRRADPKPAAPASNVAQPAATESVVRADALLDDLKRREAAQQEFDRKNPPRATAIVIPESVPASIPQPQPAPGLIAPTTRQPAPTAPTAPANDGHDESSWRQRSQSLQQKLDQELARLAEADKQNLKYGYGDAQAIYKERVEAVAAARQAIDQLHDEARRAGIPPAWLR